MSQVIFLGGGGNAGGNVLTVTGDVGGPCAPNGVGNLNLFGGPSVTVTGNAATHTLTIDISGVIPDSFDTDSGTAVPAAGVLNIVGASGGNITTSGSGNTVDIAVVGTTDHAVQIGNVTGSLTSLSVGASGTVLVGNTAANPSFSATPSVSSITIMNAPVVGTDGTNKDYVDMLSAGFDFKNSCFAGTTADLNATYNNGVAGVGATLTNAGALVAFSVDGQSPSLNDRILVKDQTNQFENGIYTLTTVGSGAVAWVLTRSTDYDTITEISAGNIVPVEFGTINENTLWLQTATVAVIGTDAIIFTKFLGQGITTLVADAGAATGTSVMITGGTGITTSASGANLTIDLDTPVSIANGGTNATTFATTDGTVYFDGTRLVTTATGTSGQILTSNGAGVAPTYQNAPSTNITITGDTGGGLSGTSFTFTGGTTGLTFNGAGTTETLGGTLSIANGGTNATSMSTMNGIVKYNGTSLVTSTTAQIDASNRYTNSSQPSFSAYKSANTVNTTGDGTNYTVIFDTEFFDIGNNYDNTTGIFTAPVTGRYLLHGYVCVTNLSAGHTNGIVTLVTTSNSYGQSVMNPFVVQQTAGGGFVTLSAFIITQMTAADTAHFSVQVAGSTLTVTVVGNGSGFLTVFSGYLLG